MGREKFSPTDNIDDLPPELVKELRISSNMKLRILDVFREGGGTLNISETMIGLYRLYHETKNRDCIVATLWRMYKQGLLYRTGIKGEYTINERHKQMVHRPKG